jgi:Mg2+-importing ATPase
VRLCAGDLVPADVRLIASRDVFVSQSALTGEALPVEKHDTAAAAMEKPANAGGADSAGVLDCSNICFLGTKVVSGSRRAWQLEQHGKNRREAGCEKRFS